MSKHMATGRMLARSALTSAATSAISSSCGSGVPYSRGTTMGAARRGERQVGCGEALAAQVGTTVGEQLRNVVQLAEHGGLVADLAPGGDVEHA